MSKVYIVNHAGHDYSAAQRWGDLVSITTGHVSQGSLDRLLYDVSVHISKSEPLDWLLPSGLLVLNVISSALWLRKHGELRLLIRDRKFSTYREMTLSSSHLDYLIQSVSADENEDAKTSRTRPEGGL